MHNPAAAGATAVASIPHWGLYDYEQPSLSADIIITGLGNALRTIPQSLATSFATELRAVLIWLVFLLSWGASHLLLGWCRRFAASRLAGLLRFKSLWHMEPCTSPLAHSLASLSRAAPRERRQRDLIETHDQ